MRKSWCVYLTLFVFLCASVTTVTADKPSVRGPFSFDPLSQTAAVGSQPVCAPVALPDGFSQRVIVSGTGACGGSVLDIYPGVADLTDMNAVNESGQHAGRYLYRTQELGTNGSVSVIDLQTGEAKVLVQNSGWRRLDGLRWTPWGTLLFSEEAGANGRLFEIVLDPHDPMTAAEVIDRPSVGRMSHEGISVDPQGNVYVGDEFNGGAIFRFVPDHYGDLSAGTLYALKIVDESAAPGVGTGTAEWVALVPGQNGVVTAPSMSARAAASEAGVTGYNRPEDYERIGQTLYFAATGTNNVYAVSLVGEPFVTEFVAAGVNVGSAAGFGLQDPDNLTSDNAGNLYIVEDNSPADIWVATPDLNRDGRADSVVLFATLTTPGSEGTGIYFSPTQPRAMFLNVQHPSNNNDTTILITKD
jgi:secreted PhoX family phosphatase